MLWRQVESYERPSFKRVFNPRTERESRQGWTRYEAGEAVDSISIGLSIDGILTWHHRRTDPGAPNDPASMGERRSWPRPRGPSAALGDGSCGEVDERMERVPSEGKGPFMCIGPHPRPATGTRGGAGSPAWPIDLDVESIQKEARFNPQGGLESITFRALLEDGSRVVIGWERFHITLLPLSEWEAIEELVYGE